MDVDIKAVRRDLACKASQRNPFRVTCIWNNAFFPGQLVEYRSSPQAQPTLHKTRSRATVLNGHTPVVWLEGVSGCVAVDACTPVEVQSKGSPVSLPCSGGNVGMGAAA